MISPALRQVYASAPRGQLYVETLELSHSAFPQTFYINNANELWTFLLVDGGPAVDFSPVPFKIIFPTLDGRGQQDLQLVLDNVGRDAMEAIEAAAAVPQENIHVICRVYLNIDNSLPQNDPPLALALSGIEINKAAITGTATRADTLNRPFPSYYYRTDNFPGLAR
jgi:hypothetical protein